MKKIIFCNSLESVKEIVKTNESFYYLLIDYNKQSIEINNFLNSKTNYRAIEINKIFEHNQDYLYKFINFVGNLNVNNGNSFLWWALNFTNKNPISTPLCNKIYYCLIIPKIIKNIDIDLLIISDDKDLLKQLRIWARKKEIEIIDLIRKKRSIKNVIKNFTPLAIFFAFFRSILLRFYVRNYFKCIYDKKINYIVVLSLLNYQSFDRDGNYRDTYFGNFINYLKEKNIPFLNLLLVLMPFSKEILKKTYNQSKKIPIITLDYFLNLFDLLICLFYSLKRYFFPNKIKGIMEIDGINLSFLIKKTIRNDYISSYFYDNLKIWFAIRNLAKQITIKNFYYPFENRPFEKMSILALKKNSPSTRIIGYQHASLSLRHTNFLLTKEEVKIIPLPDKILTMGEITKEFMQNIGNFPGGLLRIGCALRQQVYKGDLKKRKEKIVNLLVALATNLEEYIKVILFLNDALGNNSFYQIWIRPHPVYSLDEAIKISGIPQFKFYKANRESLDECFNWADVVLYVHSTLSIEALFRGIPVINIGINDILNPDPLINFDTLKWYVDSPKELIFTIETISSINEEEFLERQKKAKEYATKYMYAVTDEKLNEFLNA